MDAQRRKRLLVFAAILAVIMLGVGVSAVTSSGYRSVCELARLDKPIDVIVVGNTTFLKTGNFVLVIGDSHFKTTMYRASFALVERMPGSPRFGPYDTDNGYAVFILKDNRGACGATILALYSASDFASKYNLQSVIFEQEVVVQGRYDPTLHAKIIDLRSGRVVYEGPVLIVEKILKGCHDAYSEKAVSIG